MKDMHEMYAAYIQRDKEQKAAVPTPSSALKTAPAQTLATSQTVSPNAASAGSNHAIPSKTQVIAPTTDKPAHPVSHNAALTERKAAAVSPFTVPQNRDLGFTDETYRVLNQYNQEQCNKIIGFFFEMLRNFSSQFTHLYGSEPDEEFAMFAVDLEPEDAQRVVEHLKERLLAGKEWPPAPGMLRMLKDLPLNSEVFEARHNILVLKQPKTRVERYIMSRKSTRLKALSERNLADEFRMLYVESFDEVRRNVDIDLDTKQRNYSHTIAHTPPTERDKQIEQMVQQGVELEPILAERLKRIHALRQQQSKTTVEQEQAELAQKIRSQC